MGGTAISRLAGIESVAVDLPSHATPPGSRADDVDLVAAAIRGATRSDGGAVIAELPEDVDVAHLVLVGVIPSALRLRTRRAHRRRSTLLGFSFRGDDLFVLRRRADVVRDLLAG
jgi:hypothetical protein